MEYPTLEAVGTNRVIDVTALDRPAIFICYAESTQHGATAIEEAVRAKYSAAQVLVAHVIDLHAVPGMFKSVARGILNSEYQKATAALPPGETAADYVVILPDWDAKFVYATGLEEVDRRLGVAVFNVDGTFAGLAYGADVVAKTLRLLEGALG
jgi:hypothetical protein